MNDAQTIRAVQAIDIAVALLAQTLQVMETIARAQAESRDVTAAELEDMAQADDDARKRLQDAIDAAKAGGATA